MMMMLLHALASPSCAARPAKILHCRCRGSMRCCCGLMGMCRCWRVRACMHCATWGKRRCWVGSAACVRSMLLPCGCGRLRRQHADGHRRPCCDHQAGFTTHHDTTMICHGPNHAAFLAITSIHAHHLVCTRTHVFFCCLPTGSVAGRGRRHTEQLAAAGRHWGRRAGVERGSGASAGAC